MTWDDEYDATDTHIRQDLVLASLAECVVLLLWVATCAVAVWLLGTVRGLALTAIGAVVSAYAVPRLLDRYAVRREPTKIAPPTRRQTGRTRVDSA